MLRRRGREPLDRVQDSQTVFGAGKYCRTSNFPQNMLAYFLSSKAALVLCSASVFFLSATEVASASKVGEDGVPLSGGGGGGLRLIAWIYGAAYGGYTYALKMFIYEKARYSLNWKFQPFLKYEPIFVLQVRARNFARAWALAQCSMSTSTLIGVPLTSKSISFPQKYIHVFLNKNIYFSVPQRPLLGHCKGREGEEEQCR